MIDRHRVSLTGRLARAACVAATLLLSAAAQAVELADMKGFEQLFGRYAPGGDCTRQPRIVVDVRGMAFEVDGKSELVTNPEYAASYGGASYQGKSQYFFPFRLADGYAILMTFNEGEVEGRLTIGPHDENPPGARNGKLVKGSPYLKCK